MTVTAIDFSAGPPSAASIKAAGHTGTVLYISEAREDWMTGKNPSREYLDDLDAHGIKFAFVFQYRKGGSIDTGDAGRGYEGGVADAIEARDRLNSLGCAGHPVYFAVDWDVSITEWNTRVYRYFTGAISVLGRQRVGIYGHSRAVSWAQQDGVVAEIEPGRVLGWVTQSWKSRDDNGNPRGKGYAALFQGTHNVTGPDGVQIDINEVWADEWGWRALPDHDVDAPGMPTGVDPEMLPRVDKFKWLNKHYTKGRNRKIKYLTRHHLAGIGTTEDVWGWWQDRAASGHYVVENGGIVGQLVKRADTAWGNADAGSNNETIVIEHANITGAPGWGIADDIIRRGAELAAELCIVEDLGRPLFGLNIRDHREFTATSCPHHLARGEKYHDQWMHHAQQHYDRLTTQTAPKPTFLEELMSAKVPSFVNPEKEFDGNIALGLVDKATWENRALLNELFRQLGLDAELTVQKAIAADREGK